MNKEIRIGGKWICCWMAVFFLHCSFFAGLRAAPYQDRVITGKVSSSVDGTGIPGVNILIQGTSTGTVSDENGEYSISIPEGSDAVLVFTAIGFASEERSTAGQSIINVELSEDTQALDEVVVVGYGTQKKINLTGSVGVVEAEDLENRPVASIEEALQGQVAGLNIVRTSGQPGNQAININIRGTSTFSNNPALIVIDGVPTASNILDRLNPNDIESISVLKDAASAAIYGSRATGGVILITTKTGRQGAPQFRYNGSIGVQRPTRFPEKVSALDHALLSNEARANDGGSAKFSDADLARFSSEDWVDHDWDDYMMNDAVQTDHNFSISGGNESQDYYLSFGYFKQDGVVINSDFERFNIRLNQNIKVSDKFNLRFRGGYSPSLRTAPVSIGNLLAFVAAQPKIDAYKSPNGRWLTNSSASGGIDPVGNAMARGSEDGGQQVIKEHNITGNISLDYEVIPNLILTGTYGLIRNQTRQRTYQSKITLYEQNDHEEIAAQSVDNFLEVDNSYNVAQNTSILANYSNTIADHNFTILGGFTAEWFEQANDFIGTRNFLTDNIFTVSAGSSDPNHWNIAGGAADWALASFLARTTYSFKDKYLFEAAMRNDGSSRFAEGLKWGLFPSVSAGWVVSQEQFLQNNRVLTFFKLRASWGQVGNQNVGFYPFANTLTQSAYFFNGSPQRAVQTGGAPNPILTWETKEAINIGIEGSVFDNLLEFEIDLFNEKTKDILLQLPLPRTFGQPEPVQNAGRVDNRGWEVQLRHRNTIGEIGYGISFQLADATNEVVDMGGVSPRITENTITEEGYPMDEWYGIKADGFFQTEQEIEGHATQNPRTSPGDIKYVDENGDGVIDSGDRVRLGRSDPRFPFGLKINFQFKNFDFSAFGQGVMHHLVWSNGWTAVNFERENSTLRTYHLDRWTPENTDARFPKTRMGSGAARNGINDRFSSFWLEDASYFRLKHIELGYNLPDEITNLVNLAGVRVYASAENLFTITDYLGYDPEVPTGTSARLVEGRYPISKVFNFGVNINF